MGVAMNQITVPANMSHLRVLSLIAPVAKRMGGAKVKPIRVDQETAFAVFVIGGIS